MNGGDYEGFLENDNINFDISGTLFEDIMYLDQLLFNNYDDSTTDSIISPPTATIMAPTAAPALAGATEMNAAIDGDHQQQSYQYQSSITIRHRGRRTRKSNNREYSTLNHNVLERRRTEKIREKIERLYQMIPYHTVAPDRVSMLEHVIQYIKTLKNRIDVMTSVNDYYNQMVVHGHPYIPIVGLNPFDLGQSGTVVNNNPAWTHTMVMIPNPNHNSTMISPVAPFPLPPSPPQP